MVFNGRGHSAASSEANKFTAVLQAGTIENMNCGIGPCDQPEEIARRLAHEPGFVFLDSSLVAPGSMSILGCRPERILAGSASEFDMVENELAARSRITGDLGVPSGALIGWVAFDGSFRFGVYTSLLVFQHDNQEWLQDGAIDVPKVDFADPWPRVDFRPRLSKDAYCAMVLAAKEYIAAGDIYQVCLAHAFESEWSGHPWDLYAELRLASPAPYGACLHLDDAWVLSSSPECFLRMSGSHAVTRPIKGTRPRSSEPHADERLAYELITSSKEIAELAMITDLERNDLGSICTFGSVRVPDFLRLERFAQVFHLLSTVEGELRPDVSHPRALAKCFPGGSISGAPKKRALEIIRELEPDPRGIYTGAIGYFGFNGESAFNIAIRTAVIHENRALFHSGAGIVADSLPEMEWQETLHKAAGILQAAGRVTMHSGRQPPLRKLPEGSALPPRRR